METNYRKAGIMNQYRPGISSSMLPLLHSICIDDKIVNYPKWHLFRSFELLAGKSFFKINKHVPITKTISYTRSVLKHGKYHTRNNIRNILLNNKDFQSFCKNKDLQYYYKIIENSCMNDKNFRVTYDIIKAKCEHNQPTNFWFTNHFLNTSFLYKFLTNNCKSK